MTLQVDHLIMEALREDISSEDVTTNAVMHEAVTGEVDLICKQDGVIAGLQIYLSRSGSPAGNTNEVLPAAQRFGILHERGIRTAQVVRNSSAQPLQERFLLNPQPQQILCGAYQQLFVLA